MTFLMMWRHADRDLLDLAVTWSIAMTKWVALLSCICATVWSTPATAKYPDIDSRRVGTTIQ